jgi:hypothetical protein
MRFTVNKQADLDEDIVTKVAEEVVEWMGENHLLNFPDGDARSYDEVARDWVRERREVTG